MRRAVAAMVVTLTLAACRGEAPQPAASPGETGVGSTSAAPPTSTACALVTEDEVRAAVGVAMQASDGTQGTDRPTSICEFRSGERILLVRLNPDTGDRDLAVFPYGPPTPVPGVGDGAKFTPGTAEGLATLATAKGHAGITVLYRGPGDRREILTKVAQAAIARL